MARYRSSARRLCFAIPVVPPSRRRVMAPRFPSSDAASVPETARSVVDSGSVKSAPRCAEPPYSPRIMGTGRLLPRQTCLLAWFWRLAILPRSPLDSADFSPISRICPNLGHSVTRKISCWSRSHRKRGGDDKQTRQDNGVAGVCARNAHGRTTPHFPSILIMVGNRRRYARPQRNTENHRSERTEKSLSPDASGTTSISTCSTRLQRGPASTAFSKRSRSIPSP